VRLLLGTHAFLWFIVGDGRLSATARALEDLALVSADGAFDAYPVQCIW
jgi:PIN domain nuclease of toxin-antitoxin system